MDGVSTTALVANDLSKTEDGCARRAGRMSPRETSCNQLKEQSASSKASASKNSIFTRTQRASIFSASRRIKKRPYHMQRPLRRRRVTDRYDCGSYTPAKSRTISTGSPLKSIPDIYGKFRGNFGGIEFRNIARNHLREDQSRGL